MSTAQVFAPVRFPWLATVLVLVAVAVMVSLGIWQLHRLAWKQALISRYEMAGGVSGEVAWPKDAGALERALYRRSHVDCAEVWGFSAIAGRNARGQAGWAHVATCRLAQGGTARIILGWSGDPGERAWNGGRAAGIIAGGGAEGPRLVADPPLAGLESNARPDPRELPNNHFSYAVQWFLFAATALVIYAIALAKRLAPARFGR